MALGAFFSAAEVIPLTFLTLEAWSFLQLGTAQETRARTPFPHLWAVMFLASVGFWNFLGAGIFGFLINLPIVSYYEIGTALTANHGHAAMMGVYGMLAVGLALFCLRYGPARTLVRPRSQNQLLVLEYRAGVDGLRHSVSTRAAPALCKRQPKLLRRQGR
jgi:nitric oxide reductase large subunit